MVYLEFPIHTVGVHTVDVHTVGVHTVGIQKGTERNRKKQKHIKITKNSKKA